MVEVTAEKILPQHWTNLEELSHQVCFGQFRASSLNRHHFVIGGFVNKELSGYYTCLEMDSETVYIQHGGAFPNFEKTHFVVQGYQKMLEVLEADYKRAWTRIENTNRPMLKMALQAGFLITGVYNFKNKVLVELEKEFNQGEII